MVEYVVRYEIVDRDGRVTEKRVMHTGIDLTDPAVDEARVRRMVNMRHDVPADHRIGVTSITEVTP